MSLAQDERTNKMAVGPLKWMSFEALEFQKFSEYSDVWSYGVMCVEILTR
jgi:serine/threonine protein kinase